jgi:hypothetical protein
MSGTAGGSRPTNETNSVNAGDAGISGGGDAGGSDEEEIPTPEERASEFFEAYPERAHLPLTSEQGQPLRRAYIEEETEEWHTEPATESETGLSGTEVTKREPVTWGRAVERTLESHAETRQTEIHLERGQPGGNWFAEFDVQAEDRWSASYQKRYFGALHGTFREFTGGERPSGGETEATFDDPRVVLVTRSASSVPGGSRIGPVEHAADLTDGWEPVYHALRNLFRRHGCELGEGWVYDRRAEPHKNEKGNAEGVNACYGHEHVPIIVDAAQFDGELTEETFRGVVEKHVEATEYAGPEAHGLHRENWDEAEEPVGAVEVFEPSEKADVVQYVADYTGVEPVDLLERDVEYVAWASAMSAANKRTVTRSTAAHAAAVADRCKQRAESEKSEQDLEHGEKVTVSDRAGYEYECLCCGSPHGIEQDHETLTAARLADDGGGEVAADGGSTASASSARSSESLAASWPTAESAAAVGEAPGEGDRRERVRRAAERLDVPTVGRIAGEVMMEPSEVARYLSEIEEGVDPDEVVTMARMPPWRVCSVRIGEEEYPASSGSGVDMVAVDFGATEALRRTLTAAGERSTRWRCECGTAVYGGEMAGHLAGKHDIDDPAVALQLVEEDERVGPSG